MGMRATVAVGKTGKARKISMNTLQHSNKHSAVESVSGLVIQAPCYIMTIISKKAKDREKNA